MHMIKQISVFLENKKGRLSQVTQCLKEAGIDLRALSIADTTDFGILRFVVNDPDGAYGLLQAQGFTVSMTEVIAVEIPDQPGALADVLALLNAADVNVEYLYAFGMSGGPHRVLNVLRLSDTEKGIHTLLEKGVRLFCDEEIRKL
ncbi:MAG: amino acid-binding protein [Peptococcaceae bacterium]|nr:amino acid-binding protein [Peptococcaceae bacterium]